MDFTLSSPPITGAMKGAIAGGVIALIAVLVGIGAFVYFYWRSSKTLQPVHVGKRASYSSALEQDLEQGSGDGGSTIVATPSGSPKVSQAPTPTPSPIPASMDTEPEPTTTRSSSENTIAAPEPSPEEGQNRISGYSVESTQQPAPTAKEYV